MPTIQMGSDDSGLLHTIHLIVHSHSLRGDVDRQRAQPNAGLLEVLHGREDAVQILLKDLRRTSRAFRTSAVLIRTAASSASFDA
jgi:hypothetical protein